MTRCRRKYGKSKTYHIILKGIDNQDIFYNDSDREFFLDQILISKKEFPYNVYTYCLMDNHVHMVVKAEKENLSKAMQSLMVRYVHYFNQKYNRVGPLVQYRFKSKNIENQRYFLDVCRYVHRNPENAEIAKTGEYKWSSYNEYLGDAKIVDKNILLHYLDNDIKNFINYTLKENENEKLEEFAEYEVMGKLKDEEISNIIIEMFNIGDVDKIPTFFKKLTKEELKEKIAQMKRIKGTNKTQIARVIRINRWTLEKIWQKI